MRPWPLKIETQNFTFTMEIQVSTNAPPWEQCSSPSNQTYSQLHWPRDVRLWQSLILALSAPFFLLSFNQQGYRGSSQNLWHRKFILQSTLKENSPSIGILDLLDSGLHFWFTYYLKQGMWEWDIQSCCHQWPLITQDWPGISRRQACTT